MLEETPETPSRVIDTDEISGRVTVTHLRCVYGSASYLQMAAASRWIVSTVTPAHRKGEVNKYF